MKSILILVLSTSLAVALPPDVGNIGIVGGTDAVEGEFPYQISLQDETNFKFCGGTLYNEKFVITAYHCTESYDINNPTDFQVVAGELDCNITSGNEQTRKVIRIIQNQFSTTTLENDIALLEVDVPFDLNEFVKPIPIPAKLQSFTGDCVVSGWGTMAQGTFVTPSILQKVTVPIVSDEECSQDYTSWGTHTLPTPSMICAGETDKDACKGDSGGPLACDGFLAGIVSWGRGCARTGYPGVYTEVSYFTDWIIENAISQRDDV